MFFAWPAALWGLVLVGAFGLIYLRVLARPARIPVAWTTVASARIAAARPYVPLPVPADQSAIMLTLDVSGSMRSQDMQPSRLAAAQAAAREFVRTLPPRARVGLVAFAGYATVLSLPTTDHNRILELIDGVWYARRTAIGEGLAASGRRMDSGDRGAAVRWTQQRGDRSARCRRQGPPAGSYRVHRRHRPARLLVQHVHDRRHTGRRDDAGHRVGHRRHLLPRQHHEHDNDAHRAPLTLTLSPCGGEGMNSLGLPARTFEA